MDCPACGEFVRAAAIICQYCGTRLERPAEGSGSATPFDRRAWKPLPPVPNSSCSGAGLDLVLELIIEFPFSLVLIAGACVGWLLLHGISEYIPARLRMFKHRH